MSAPRTIIAGSRTITDPAVIPAAVLAAEKFADIVVQVLVSGVGRKRDRQGRQIGVDYLAEQWALEHGIPIIPKPAQWNDIRTPGAVVKQGPLGPYNALAGPWRNQEMVSISQNLIAIREGGANSKGTTGIILLARNAGLKVFVFDLEQFWGK